MCIRDRVVYVKLPDGRWSIASTHNVAHGGQTISGNNFDGQHCVHFLRDMDECKQNDPDSVSYTHLDVYKRQVEDHLNEINTFEKGCWVHLQNPTREEIDGINARFALDPTYIPVSYTHLAVYKRQPRKEAST